MKPKKNRPIGIKNVSMYKGRYCAELENGKYILNNGSMYLMLCEKVEDGMKVLKDDIVGGIIMRDEESFRWCVEHLSEVQLTC